MTDTGAISTSISTPIPTQTGAIPAVPVPDHEFCAGRLALDFCNTLSPGRPAPGNDRLADAASLTAWAGRAGWRLAGPTGGDTTVGPGIGPGDLAGFRSLRDRLRNLFVAVIAGQVPAADDVEALDGAMIDAFSALRLAPGRDRPLAWQDAAQPLDRLRHAIARDAVDLLTAADPARLKRCAGEGCGWFLYDSSKNGKRRWCVMEDCGTLDKVRRFRARHRAAPGF